MVLSLWGNVASFCLHVTWKLAFPLVQSLWGNVASFSLHNTWKLAFPLVQSLHCKSQIDIPTQFWSPAFVLACSDQCKCNMYGCSYGHCIRGNLAFAFMLLGSYSFPLLCNLCIANPKLYIPDRNFALAFALEPTMTNANVTCMYVPMDIGMRGTSSFCLHATWNASFSLCCANVILLDGI